MEIQDKAILIQFIRNNSQTYLNKLNWNWIVLNLDFSEKNFLFHFSSFKDIIMLAVSMNSSVFKKKKKVKQTNFYEFDECKTKSVDTDGHWTFILL